jgi:hypothetical protein
MRSRTTTVLLAAGTLIGCMANGPATTARPPAPPPGTHASPGDSGTARAPGVFSGAPLLLDRSDLRIGVTVEFPRLPSAAEIDDLRQMPGLAHVVIVLPDWPADLEPLLVLAQIPPEADGIVILPGYPPSRAAAEAWNLVPARLRIVIVADGPPPSQAAVQDLNGMRALERVIAEMDVPSRAGFERLQRPLSFRKVME